MQGGSTGTNEKCRQAYVVQVSGPRAAAPCAFDCGGGGQRDASSISSISSSSASQHTSHYRAPTQPPRVKWFEKSERGRNPRFCERSACAVPGRGSPHTSPCLTFRVSQLLPLCTCIPFPWLVKKKSPLPTKQACQNTPGHLFFVFC